MVIVFGFIVIKLWLCLLFLGCVRCFLMLFLVGAE